MPHYFSAATAAAACPCLLLCLASALSATLARAELLDQSLPTPYYAQDTGIASADLNGDGANDLLFATGRHWVDQSYALINLGPRYDDNGDFVGTRFSEALPIGRPGAFYQVDTLKIDPESTVSTAQKTKVLLVGGSCNQPDRNDFGSCTPGVSTPARVFVVTMSRYGCSVTNPDAECNLDFDRIWIHDDPKGDRNGGFITTASSDDSFALLGQGGCEIFRFNGDTYEPSFSLATAANDDPRSMMSRYAGFAAGYNPKLGGMLAAGRRTEWDEPEKDSNGDYIGINKIIYEKTDDDYKVWTLPGSLSGVPYGSTSSYHMQSTGFAFADINGDGVDDLLEATYLKDIQREDGYTFPQMIHFFNADGAIYESMKVMETENLDAGRSVTTGMLFGESELPDVIFATHAGIVNFFANMGLDEDGNWLGLEKRHTLKVGTDDCPIRDMVVTTLVEEDDRYYAGVVCAVTCNYIYDLGDNHIYYVEIEKAKREEETQDTTVVQNTKPIETIDEEIPPPPPPRPQEETMEEIEPRAPTSTPTKIQNKTSFGSGTPSNLTWIEGSADSNATVEDQPAATIAPSLDPELPVNWTSNIDPQTGETYYWNVVTRETTWFRPRLPSDSPISDLDSQSNMTGNIPAEQVIAEPDSSALCAMKDRAALLLSTLSVFVYYFF